MFSSIWYGLVLRSKYSRQSFRVCFPLSVASFLSLVRTSSFTALTTMTRLSSRLLSILKQPGPRFLLFLFAFFLFTSLCLVMIFHCVLFDTCMPVIFTLPADSFFRGLVTAISIGFAASALRLSSSFLILLFLSPVYSPLTKSVSLDASLFFSV